MTHLNTSTSLISANAEAVTPALDRSLRSAREPKRSNPWWVITVATALIVLGRVVYSLVGPPLIINYTASEPRGLYWIEEHDPRAYARGDLVALSTPPAFRSLIASRGWAADGVPLLKSVAALEGDRVCTDDRQISINGKAVGPIVSVDSLGRPLPKIRGCYSVQAGEFLPLSTFIPNSFDGRYMGPQSLSLIRGEAHRLWTF